MLKTPAAILSAAISLVPKGMGSGSVMYSGRQTLVPGPIYVLGFNPGGEPAKNDRTIEADLRESMVGSSDSCAYLDGCWDNGRGGTFAKGCHPLQLRFKQLADYLGLDARRIPAANAIFRRTRKAAEVHVGDFDACWPIHQLLLNTIRPRAIVSIGNGQRQSTFALLASRLSTNADRENVFRQSFRDGREFIIPMLGLGEYPPLIDVLVVGLPHFSWNPLPSDSRVMRHLKMWIHDAGAQGPGD